MAESHGLSADQLADATAWVQDQRREAEREQAATAGD